MKSFSALTVPAYRRFWIGHVVSLMGTAIQHTALLWLVYRLTESPIALGWVTFFFQAPSLVLGVLGGTIADRNDRVSILIRYYILYIAQATALAYLTLKGAVTIEQIYTLSLLHGVIAALEVPARQTLVKDLTGTQHLASGIVLNSVAFNVGRMIGPPIAGLLIYLVGEGPCFAINAASFVAVILSLMTLPRGSADGETTGGRIVPAFSVVLDFLRTDRRPRRILPLVAVISFFGIPVYSMLSVYAKEVFGMGPAALGLLTGAGGLGAVFGASLMSRKEPSRIRLSDTYVGAAMFCAFQLGFILPISFPITLLCGVGTGAALLYTLVHCNHLLQTGAPDNLRGRVISVYTSILIGLNPLGSLFVGALAERIGIHAAIGLGECVVLAFLGLVLARTEWSQVREALT